MRDITNIGRKFVWYLVQIIGFKREKKGIIILGIIFVIVLFQFVSQIKKIFNKD